MKPLELAGDLAMKSDEEGRIKDAFLIWGLNNCGNNDVIKTELRLEE